MIALVERLKKKHGSKRKLCMTKIVDFDTGNKIPNRKKHDAYCNGIIYNDGVKTTMKGFENNDTDITKNTKQSTQDSYDYTKHSEVVYENVAKKMTMFSENKMQKQCI